MIIAQIVFLGFVVGLATARIRQNETEGCPKLERDWEDKLDRLFANLPKEVQVLVTGPRRVEYREVLPGLSLSTDRITGLDGLEPDRPYQTFCDNNTRTIMFNLRTTSYLLYTLPWKLCTGNTGNISVILPSAKFEGELSFTRTWHVNSPDMRLRISPSRLEPSNVRVDGLGPAVSHLAHVFSVPFEGQLRQLWTGILRDQIRTSLFKVARVEKIRFGNV